MILKRNKFVSQWRKFEFKRSYIFKDMDFSISWIFLDFSRIYFDFKPFKNGKKGDFISPQNSWNLRGSVGNYADAT